MTIISGWRFQVISVVSERISEWWQYVVPRSSVRLGVRLDFPLNMKKENDTHTVNSKPVLCVYKIISIPFLSVFFCTGVCVCGAMCVLKCVQVGVWTCVCVFPGYACGEWWRVCLLILLTAPVTAPPCTICSDVKEDLAHGHIVGSLATENTSL